MEDKCELVTINDRLGLLSQPLVSTMSHAGSTEGPRKPHDASVKASEILQCPEWQVFWCCDFLACVNS